MFILIVVIYIASLVALLAVSYPPKDSVRIRLQGSSPIALDLPEICVVTGEEATQTHVLHGYRGLPYFLQEDTIPFPFSATGWARYSEMYPISLLMFKGGLRIFRHVPLFGAGLAILFWLPFASPLCGLISFWDLARRRRPLVKVHAVDFDWRDRLRAVDFAVMSENFAEEFFRLNADISYSEWKQQFAAKTSPNPLVVAGVLIALLALALIVNFVLLR